MKFKFKNFKTQVEVMKSVRKKTHFVGRAYGSPKGAKGYNRKKFDLNKEV